MPQLKLNILLISFLGVFVLMPSASQAQAPTPAQKHKAEVCEKVYKKVVAAVGDARQAPVLVFAHNKTEQENYTTYYNPKRNSIILGEGIYNIARTFGEDSLNALAFVVGHELAHYYKGHGWGMAFGSSAEDLEIAQEIYDAEISIDRKKIMEAEADYFGGLFGYLAGYNTLKVGSEFIHAFYEIGFPEEVPGYPTKSDRKKIVAEVESDLAELAQVFEAANLLNITNHHQESARCYHHIASKFPSREIYNNAGVNFAIQALALFKPEENPYFYPFGLDENSRLLQGNTKGDDPVETRKELLKEAIAAFDKAIYLDKNYAPAYLNIAMAYNLLEDSEMARLMLMKAVRLSEEQKNDVLLSRCHILKGIIAASEDDKKAAKGAFELAESGSPRMAELNLNVLKTQKHYSALIVKKETQEIVSEAAESINDVDPSLVEVLLDDAIMVQLKSQDKERPKMKIYHYNYEGVIALHVKHYTRPTLQQSYIFTPSGYEGSSARGVQINDSMDKVLKEYGSPTAVKSSTSHTYYIYEKTGIIFKADKQDKVSQWILF